MHMVVQRIQNSQNNFEKEPMGISFPKQSRLWFLVFSVAG